MNINFVFLCEKPLCCFVVKYFKKYHKEKEVTQRFTSDTLLPNHQPVTLFYSITQNIHHVNSFG